MRQELEHICEGHGVEIDIDYTAVPNASPAESPFIELCRQSLALALGNDDFKLVPGADSRLHRLAVPPTARHAGLRLQPAPPERRSDAHAASTATTSSWRSTRLILRTKNALALACLTLGIQ